jgi:hypothetical protein
VILFIIDKAVDTVMTVYLNEIVDIKDKKFKIKGCINIQLKISQITGLLSIILEAVTPL